MKRILSLLSPFVFLFVVQPVSAASLSLSQASTPPNVTVSVMLNTENKPVAGVDLHATYDHEKLKLVSVKKGTLFPTYTEPTINNGSVSISAVVAPETTYRGSGKFAELVFEPIKNGDAIVKLTYKQGDRNDSNIADTSGNDILTKTDNVVVKVSGAAGSSTGFFQKILDFLIFWD